MYMYVIYSKFEDWEMKDLKDKVIIITGASAGIGKQCAINCSRLGAKLALIGRNDERLAGTAMMLAGEGHLTFAQDITEYDILPDMIFGIVQKMGVISGFIHSAGIETVLPIRMVDHTHWEKAFATNVFAAFELTKQIIRKKNINPAGASIIYIASVMGVTGQPIKTVYGATKGALIAGTKSLALELARNKVRVNCVSPGMVRTEMSEMLLAKVTPEAYQDIIKAHPLGIGETEDVAEICSFLLSDSAKWITGTNILVDGGYTAQ
jgi:NAD(P)-dependent dehydrogenase (short-subunit alcohol dehydrogenase family)